MLEVVEVRPEEKYLKLKCDECSTRFGFEVDMDFRFIGNGAPRLRRFVGIHENCGLAELDARLRSYGIEDLEEKTKESFTKEK